MNVTYLSKVKAKSWLFKFKVKYSYYIEFAFVS